MKSPIAIAQKGNREAVFLISFFLVCITSVFLVYSGYLLALGQAMAFFLLVGIAYKFPKTGISLYLLTAVFPAIFQMTPIFNENYAYLGSGLYANDVVLLAMMAAAAVKFLGSRKGVNSNAAFSWKLHAIFFAWILFEILRNVRELGISAAGEFRFQYLSLALLYYVYFSFETPAKRASLFKGLMAGALLLPLAMVPILGTLKGWTFGPDSRFLPASISLGLAYGILGLFINRKFRMFPINPLVLIMAIALGVLFILIDSHRSVWIAGVTLIILMSLLKSFRDKKNIALLLISIIAGIVVFTAFDKGRQIGASLLSRGEEIIYPTRMNNTAKWRLDQWNLQMELFWNSPLLGDGFGRYWGASRQKGDTGVAPHSLYIQMLAKIGLVGLIVYILIFVQIGVIFRRRTKGLGGPADREKGLILMALLVLIASHVFYTTYSLESYSILFVGLGMAATRNSR